MTADPLAPLLDLAGVVDDLTGARDRVDQALRHRALRRQGGAVAAEVGLRSATASAALEGSGYEVADVRAGTVTDPVVQGALRLAGELPVLADRWPRAPRQVLARLHVLAARGAVPTEALGRPVGAAAGAVSAAADAGAAVVAGRLDTLAALVSGGTRVPPALLAAVVHGELLALRPFAGPSGLVARAAARLTLIATGLDPRALLAMEVGHLRRQPEYVGAAGAFATGTPDGLRSWFRHYAEAMRVAADELTAIADEIAG